MQRKVYYLLTLLLLTMLISSCDNDVVDPSKEKGIVLVSSSPDAAEIWVDGTNTKKLTPAKLELLVGEHIITVRKKQYVSKSVTIDVKSNQNNIVDIKELALLGGVTISSEPKFASIFIDGLDKESSTPDEFSLEEGEHKITLKLDEFFDTTEVVNIKNSVTTPIHIKLRSKNIVAFEGVIWDSTSTDPNRPGGLDLSTGENVFFKNKFGKNADLYYAAKNNIIASPGKLSYDNKNTLIKEGSGSNIKDRIDGPFEQDDTWSDSTYTNISNYLFLYDANGHYSKLKIVGTITQGNLKGIKVKWLYNKKPYDNFF